MAHQQSGRALADARRTLTGPMRAVKDDGDRQELATLHGGMCRQNRRAKLGDRAGRFNEVSRRESRWNPMWDLVLDARAAAAAGESEAQVMAPFERMVSLVRESFRSGDLPCVIALEIAKTREQGESSLACRCYLAEPEGSPRKAAMRDAAIRELMEERTVAQQFEERLRAERVLDIRAGRPSLVRG